MQEGRIFLYYKPLLHLHQMPRRTHNFFLTVNNYDDEEYNRILAYPNAAYVVVGKEQAPTTGTPHIHAFIRTKEPKFFREIKEEVCPRADVKGARSVPKAIRYCKKDGDFEERGDAPQASSQVTFKEVVDHANEHGLKRTREDYAYWWAQHGHTLRRNFVPQDTDRSSCEAVWLYGDTGVGKTHLARKVCPDAYIKNSRTKWWHGYEYERTVVIEDMCPGGIAAHYLLLWLDKYRCRVETKGGEMYLKAEVFIITSNYKPEEVYNPMEIGLPTFRALCRRIDILEMDSNRKITVKN